MTSMRTSPRLRGEVRDGAQRRFGVRGTIRNSEPLESPPSPARKMLATSPRKRGEVKDDYNRIRAARWLAVTQLLAV